MPFVYRYTDIDDGIVKYIGISKCTSSFKNRIAAHEQKKDKVGPGNWKIDYIKTKTLGEAHALEGHYIAKYETYDQLNTDKKEWGLISFFDESTVEWKPIDFSKRNLGLYDYFSVSDIENKCCEAYSGIREVKDYLDDLKTMLSKIEDEIVKYRRDTMSLWISENLDEVFEIPAPTITIEELYDDYCKWCKKQCIDCIDNIIDFQSLCEEKKKLKGRMKSNGTLYFFILHDSERGEEERKKRYEEYMKHCEKLWE